LIKKSGANEDCADSNHLPRLLSTKTDIGDRCEGLMIAELAIATIMVF
jgi:hypothetical protein